MRRAAKQGAIFGLGAGLLALAAAFTLAWRCLPFRISFPPPPWPWYCADPAYGVLGYLAFPAPVLTNDLAQAIVVAPLALVIYAALGTLIAAAIHAGKPH